MIKKLGRAFGRSIDLVVIFAMIVTVLSVLIQFGLRPAGAFFHIAFYLSLIVVAIMMVVKIVTNFKAIEKDRLPFLITNIVSFSLLAVVLIGLHVNLFENQTPAIVVNYVSLAIYMFTALCLL